MSLLDWDEFWEREEGGGWAGDIKNCGFPLGMHRG